MTTEENMAVHLHCCHGAAVLPKMMI